MKKLLFMLMALVTVVTTNAQNKDIEKLVEFKNANYDFGKIPYGKAVKYDLEIKNISKDVITLENVQVGCGCTTPEYEKGQKIAPGETAKVVLGFNGSSMGAFTKYVTLFFNDNMSKQVSFKGEAYQVPDNGVPGNNLVKKLKPSTAN
ncbi:MAG: DUF1573 domain-containing protein [Chitinophagaceae bacterium]